VVTETMESGWTNSSPTSITINGLSQDSSGNDFFNYQPGSITVCKFDAATRLPLEGSTFQLWRKTGATQVSVGFGAGAGLSVAAAKSTMPGYVQIGGDIVLGQDSEGNCYTWYDLDYGEYLIVELLAPAGYLTVEIDPVFITRDSKYHEVNVYDPRIPSPSYGSITLNKSGLDSTDTAGFTLYDSSNNPVGLEKTVTGNGTVQWTGLLNGTYKIVETTVPSGYDKMDDITGIVVDGNNLNHTFDRTNTETPRGGTPRGGTPPGGALTVLGIQELPFTGMNPAIPISGITMILGGVAMFIASLKKRFRRK